jgi:hypothetical protein
MLAASGTTWEGDWLLCPTAHDFSLPDAKALAVSFLMSPLVGTAAAQLLCGKACNEGAFTWRYISRKAVHRLGDGGGTVRQFLCSREPR